MKITKSQLKQIIKEEIESFVAKQYSASVNPDRDEGIDRTAETVAEPDNNR